MPLTRNYSHTPKPDLQTVQNVPRKLSDTFSQGDDFLASCLNEVFPFHRASSLELFLENPLSPDEERELNETLKHFALDTLSSDNKELCIKWKNVLTDLINQIHDIQGLEKANENLKHLDPNDSKYTENRKALQFTIYNRVCHFDEELKEYVEKSRNAGKDPETIGPSFHSPKRAFFVHFFPSGSTSSTKKVVSPDGDVEITPEWIQAQGLSDSVNAGDASNNKSTLVQASWFMQCMNHRAMKMIGGLFLLLGITAIVLGTCGIGGAAVWGAGIGAAVLGGGILGANRFFNQKPKQEPPPPVARELQFGS